ncbi:Methenyltetrahydrofolate cyclohydrolase [Durusdinium trenchii]|uniref:Methenyltetrahydrofolate cyclohydrolase n=1 Tax=Durusdinium trenchii TaxID=1381693 RepID=A0ABP0JQ79_9DINO
MSVRLSLVHGSPLTLGAGTCTWHQAHGNLTFTTSFDNSSGMDMIDPGKMLGGPPRKDLKDEKIFSDEPQSMDKLQQMDVEKRAKKPDAWKEKPQEEELAEQDKQDVEELEHDSKKMRTEGANAEDESAKRDEDSEENEVAESRTSEVKGSADNHEYFAQSRIVAPPYFKPIQPEDEIPVAVATTQDQWRRQRIAKAQVQVAQDQMQLAKDTQALAEGQDKLTNLRVPGVAKEELLAEQVRDQKRIALDQELLLQSQKRLAEDMDNAVDGKLRWERLEDYRKKRIERFQDMVNEKLDRLYKEEIEFVKRNRKGKLRGAPINVPQFGSVGVRVVSGDKAALATGGNDGSEALQGRECREDSKEEAEAIEEANAAKDPDNGAVEQQDKPPVLHSCMAETLLRLRWEVGKKRFPRRSSNFFPQVSVI